MNHSFQGTWELKSFELESTTGETKPWGVNVRGLLIYAPTGHMSVSINKNVEPDPIQSEAENVFDSILFYSGTYQVEGTLIRHQVTNASNPSRIGKEMLRHAEPNGDLLRLVTPQESFGRAILVWKRIS